MAAIYVFSIFTALISARSNNYKKAYTAFVFVMLFIIYCNVAVGNVGDLWEYERMYNYVSGNDEHMLTHATEPIFVLLERLFVSTGANFVLFRNTMYFASLAVLVYHAKKYTNNTAFFLGTYALYFFFIEGYQMRSMMAFAILIFGFSSMLRDERYCSVKFFICVVLATMVQRTFIIFMVFLAGKIKRKLSKREFVLIGTATVMVLGIEYRYKLISRLLLFDQYGQIYTSYDVHLGWLIPSFMYFLTLVVFYFVRKKALTVEDESLSLICKNTYMINAICMIFIPFLTINLSFYRFIRYGIIMNLFLYAMLLDRIEDEDKRTIYSLSIFIFSAALLVCDCLFHGGFGGVIIHQFLHL